MLEYIFKSLNELKISINELLSFEYESFLTLPKKVILFFESFVSKKRKRDKIAIVTRVILNDINNSNTNNEKTITTSVLIKIKLII